MRQHVLAPKQNTSQWTQGVIQSLIPFTYGWIYKPDYNIEHK